MSPFVDLGIKAYSITINTIDYDQIVDDQIKKQQEAYNKIQQAMVDARTAEQKAITTKAEGEAEAAKAKWEQEVVKAKATTEAEQKRDVAKLDLETAQLEKQAAVTRAEGDAKAKQLATSANNNLEEKLATYEKVNLAYAEAMGKQQWVPTVQMGGGANGGAGSELAQLLMTKTARDLALDLNPGGRK